MKKVLVTGANGFVGRFLHGFLRERGISVVAMVRTPAALSQLSHPEDGVIVSDIMQLRSENDCFRGIDAVVHLANRVHVMNDNAQDSLAEFRKVNVDGSLNLAKQAADAGVKRLVYLSSIKVNGESTNSEPFTCRDAAAPEDAYGLSKKEAEDQLDKLCRKRGLELVIIRPPLIYGPNVKGNLQNLVRMIDKGLPLPLGAVNNRRDLVSLDNLCDLIRESIVNPAAAGQIFLVSDGEAMSTSQIARYIAQAMGKKVWLLPIPVSLMSFAARLSGKGAVATRLFGNLEVDITHTKETLEWKPPKTSEEAFRRMIIR